jgi:hypothetical protein
MIADAPFAPIGKIAYSVVLIIVSTLFANFTIKKIVAETVTAIIFAANSNRVFLVTITTAFIAFGTFSRA